MVTREQPEFKRRLQADGRIVSFCTRCYAVVAETMDSDALIREEKTHSCDPNLLEFWHKIVADAKPDERGSEGAR
jgi:hypothetical protein